MFLKEQIYNHMAEAKADVLMDEGEKRLTKFAPFTSSDEKAEKARDKFLQAATQYKAAGNFLRAATAYQRASDMAQQTNCESDFISDCEEAAKCFKKANDSRSTDLFMRVVDMFDKNQKYSQAAKYCVQIAETMTGPEAVSWLNKAQKYYRNDRSTVTANEVVLKMAELHVRSGDYDEARSVYEKLAREALDDRLQRGGARKLFFNALLCQIAEMNGSNISEGVNELQERFQEYQDLDTQFSDLTREHMLIHALIDAIENQDIDKYDDALHDYDTICPLNDKQMKMLLRGKQALRSSDIR
jgi:alpha-soluble NSF attachment protein